jgi:hypothetical protein
MGIRVLVIWEHSLAHHRWITRLRSLLSQSHDPATSPHA